MSRTMRSPRAKSVWAGLFEWRRSASHNFKHPADAEPLWAPSEVLLSAFRLLVFFFIVPFSLVSFPPLLFSPDRLPRRILRCQPLPTLQPLTSTLTLPCLCHWDESERYHNLTPTTLQGLNFACLISLFAAACYSFQIPPPFFFFAFQPIRTQTEKRCSWLKEILSFGI